MVGDRKSIGEFTGRPNDDLGGYPVNSPDGMIFDYTLNSRFKTMKEGLYDIYRKRKPSRRTTGGFINDIKKAWKQLRQKRIQNAIGVILKIRLVFEGFSQA